MQDEYKVFFPQQLKDRAEHAWSFWLWAFCILFYFTMVNRPEDLAEGTGADCLPLVICKEGSGKITPTYTVLKGTKKLTKRDPPAEERLQSECR